eukprot:2925767-Rhodomonas_salina.1
MTRQPKRMTWLHFYVFGAYDGIAIVAFFWFAFCAYDGTATTVLMWTWLLVPTTAIVDRSVSVWYLCLILFCAMLSGHADPLLRPRLLPRRAPGQAPMYSAI